MLNIENYELLKSHRVQPKIGMKANLVSKVENDRGPLFYCSLVEVIDIKNYLVIVKNQVGNELTLAMDDDWVEYKIGRRNSYESFLSL